MGEVTIRLTREDYLRLAQARIVDDSEDFHRRVADAQGQTRWPGGTATDAGGVLTRFGVIEVFPV